MMLWRSGPKTSAEVHDDLSKAELSELAMSLLHLAERALFAQALVVSPGSQESVKHLIQLKGLVESLEADQADAKKVARIEEKVEDLRSELGNWQRQQAANLVDDFADAVKGLAMAAGDAMDSQDEHLVNLGAMHQRLNRVKDSNDIEEMRETLRREAEVARELVRTQQQRSERVKEEFQSAVRDLNVKIAHAEEASQTDHLTKLGNRAAFEFYAEAAQQKVRHGDGDYTIAMIDLDGFKALNDRLGHAAGDEALNAFAGRLRRQFPRPAFVGRLGGDEFVVVSRLDERTAQKRLNELETDLHRHPIQLTAGGKSELGFSFGYSGLTRDAGFKSSLARADERMYESKRARKQKSAA